MPDITVNQTKINIISYYSSYMKIMKKLQIMNFCIARLKLKLYKE